tara:strand:+ start:27276 stop:28298 length:1023 start_codon:yes stop_codon:yes gene_type:complete
MPLICCVEFDFDLDRANLNYPDPKFAEEDLPPPLLYDSSLLGKISIHPSILENEIIILGNERLLIFNLTTKTKIVIIENLELQSVTESSDGKYLYYHNLTEFNQDGLGPLYRINRDGQNKIKLVSHCDPQKVVVSNDNTTIAFTRKNKETYDSMHVTYLMDIASNTEKSIGPFIPVTFSNGQDSLLLISSKNNFSEYSGLTESSFNIYHLQNDSTSITNFSLPGRIASTSLIVSNWTERSIQAAFITSGIEMEYLTILDGPIATSSRAIESQNYRFGAVSNDLNQYLIITNDPPYITTYINFSLEFVDIPAISNNPITAAFSYDSKILFFTTGGSLYAYP